MYAVATCFLMHTRYSANLGVSRRHTAKLTCSLCLWIDLEVTYKYNDDDYWSLSTDYCSPACISPQSPPFNRHSSFPSLDTASITRDRRVWAMTRKVTLLCTLEARHVPHESHISRWSSWSTSSSIEGHVVPSSLHSRTRIWILSICGCIRLDMPAHHAAAGGWPVSIPISVGVQRRFACLFSYAKHSIDI